MDRAETGRTDSLKGSLGGLSGAPALDAAGRVVSATETFAGWVGTDLVAGTVDFRVLG